MNLSLDIVETPFWEYIGSEMDPKTFDFAKKFPWMWGTYNQQWHVLLWTPLWIPYRKFQKQLSWELIRILSQSPDFKLSSFTTHGKISTQDSCVGQLISDSCVDEYVQKWSELDAEKDARLAAAMPHVQYTPEKRAPEEIKIKYLWDVYEQTILQQIENVLSWIKPSDDRCRHYNSFRFSEWKTHLCAISDKTMDNSYHGPFQIDVFEIHDETPINTTLHNVSKCTISQVDSVTWWCDVRSGFIELARRFGNRLQIESTLP